jgi:radical SAM protein with 4Fe4S-binding SPASM domain
LIESVKMVEGLTNEEFLKITRQKFKNMVKDAKPLMTWFSLTEECNLRCRYCFADSHKPLEGELSTREVYKALDNIAKAGTEAVVFGGGEPTLRKDLLEIVNYAVKNHDMFVAINTHGQALTDKRYVRALSRAGVNQVKISVDGLEKSHDWNRGKGTFKNCIQALKNCVEEEFPSVWLIATVSQINFDEVPELIEFCAGLGVEVGMVQLLPLGRAGDLKNLMLTKEQTREWQRIMFEKKKFYGGNNVLFENRYQICEDERSLKVAVNPDKTGTFVDSPVGCISGIWQYLVGADGKIFVGDVMAPETDIGNITEKPLSEIWQNSELIQLLRDREKLKGRCGKCHLRYVCGGCRRMAFGLSGDIMGEDPQCWR